MKLRWIQRDRYCWESDCTIALFKKYTTRRTQALDVTLREKKSISRYINFVFLEEWRERERLSALPTIARAKPHDQSKYACDLNFNEFLSIL